MARCLLVPSATVLLWRDVDYAKVCFPAVRR